MSEIRVDTIRNNAGTGAPTFTYGIIIPSGQILSGIAQTAQFAQTISSTASINTTGVITATSFSGSLAATNLTGTVPTAILASGTANATTFLRGDNTWSAPSGGLTITDDTSTNASRFVTFTASSSGSISGANVSSTKLYFNPSTGILNATAVNSLSDKNRKTNIRPIENSIDIVQRLQGVRFDWIENNKSAIGLIAQEVENVIPEVVETEEDGTKTLSYGNIIGVLIEAIKEQQKRIEELEKKLNA